MQRPLPQTGDCRRNLFRALFSRIKMLFQFALSHEKSPQLG